MNSRIPHPLRLPGVWTLVLALLLLGSWGQVHRVLHTGGAAVVSATGSAASGSTHGHHGFAHGLGHAQGGSLCLLMDHLADGPSVPSAPPSVWISPAPTPDSRVPSSGVAWVAPWCFDARAPPVSA